MAKSNYMKQMTRMTCLYGLLVALCIAGAAFCAIDLASEIVHFGNEKQLPIKIENLTNNGTPLTTGTMAIGGTIDGIEATATPADFTVQFTRADRSLAGNIPMTWGWILELLNETLVVIAYLLGALGAFSLMRKQRHPDLAHNRHIAFFFWAGVLMVCASVLEAVMSLLTAHGVNLMFAAADLAPEAFKVVNILRLLFGSMLILISLILLTNKKMQEDLELTI